MVDIVLGGIAAYFVLAVPFAVVVGRSLGNRELDVRPLAEPYPGRVASERGVPLPL